MPEFVSVVHGFSSAKEGAISDVTDRSTCNFIQVFQQNVFANVSCRNDKN